MIKKLTKIRNNFLSMRVVSSLGVKNYLRLLQIGAAGLVDIVKAGDLRPLDKKMGALVKQFSYRNYNFNFDCRYCDEKLNEDSFGFGIAREIYVRDCYFKFQPPHVFFRSKTVLDIGSNRGTFATLMTNVADFILCVECGVQYVDIIRHNMEINNFSNYAIETAFLGEGGAAFDPLDKHYLLSHFIEKYQLKHIDFVKMDVEGSEFSLFKYNDWLKITSAISMEVHPHFGGNALDLLMVLDENGFVYRMADDNLREVFDHLTAAYIYAWKK